jgi:K+-transporting ATPase ATPase C chain
VIKQLRSAVVLAVSALLVFGLAYPLAGTGISQLLFPHQANGSLTQ